jgi:hypothetical protein
MAASSGAERYFRCPYHAKVINVLEMKRSRIVSIASKRTIHSDKHLATARDPLE